MLSRAEKLRDVQAEKEERLSGAIPGRRTVRIQATLLGSKSDAPEESRERESADLGKKQPL